MNKPEPASIEPEPGVIEPDRYPFHIKGLLYLPLETTLPTETCICCSRPSVGTFSKALRSAKSPLSWYKPRPATEIGLCKKHRENRLVANSLTYSLLSIGLLLLVVGIITLSISAIVIGVITASISGIFRARESIQGIDRGDDIFQIAGACDDFVRQLPEHELVEK